MRELINEFKETEVEIVAEKQQRKEIKLLGSQRKIPGLTLWEYNPTSKELNLAQFKKEDLRLKTLSTAPAALSNHHKVEVKSDCIYFQALNKTSAQRKIQKLIL